MKLSQNMHLKTLMVPEMQQSLKILPLSLLELKELVEIELTNNPFLEESRNPPSPNQDNKEFAKKLDFAISQVSRKTSLRDTLLRELSMFANSESELKIGEEIIGNIDENGYLKATLEEIADTLLVTVCQVENILKIIQQFEPPGVAARTISECLLLQLEFAGELDPLTRKIVEFHLEDIAKKNYSRIAKILKEPLGIIEPLIKKILKLDPKPGRNYSTEETNRVIPDIIIEENDEEELEIIINNEDLPVMNINKDYREMLKNKEFGPQEKEFLSGKLRNALELLRAISRRHATLRKIVETIVEIQYDAIRKNLSCLKPLTLSEVAQKIEMHESTVSRAIRNKYVKLPYGTVALKDFFSNGVSIDQSGLNISSNQIKGLINELIAQENKKHPLSDQDLCGILLKDKNLSVKRRTVAKYREELKILSSTFRKER